MKISTASNSLKKGIGIGIEAGTDKIYAFCAKDYDNKGTLRPDAKKVYLGKINRDMEKGSNAGFYLATNNYPPDAMQKLGYTQKRKESIMKKLDKIVCLPSLNLGPVPNKKTRRKKN